MDTNLSTVVVALIVSVIAPSLLAFLTNRSRRQEKIEDWKRQDDVANQAAEAAKLLINSNAEVASTLATSVTETRSKLADLKKTADGTHIIVNNQRTVMLRLIAQMAKRIAIENPSDPEAQTHAKAAQEEAAKANSAAAL
jgi:hypothetical protein